MLGVARRLFRRVFPRLEHPLLDADFSNEPADDRHEATYRAVVTRLEPEVATDPFVMNRHYEGRRWREVVRHSVGSASGVRVLDLGAGNGAIELAFTADPRMSAFSVEREWNATAVAVLTSARAPLRRTLADGVALPFRSATFDVVLCLETVEHVRNARRVGEEIARVVRRDGIILVTTPPRWRYAFAPDPHFGIRGLVMLPPAWQRSIAASRGFDEPHHHVEKLFGSIVDVVRLFPTCRVEGVLSRSRAPKRWFWDAIVLRKM